MGDISHCVSNKIVIRLLFSLVRIKDFINNNDNDNNHNDYNNNDNNNNDKNNNNNSDNSNNNNNNNDNSNNNNNNNNNNSNITAYLISTLHTLSLTIHICHLPNSITKFIISHVTFIINVELLHHCFNSLKYPIRVI